jgi:hypothetical protein
MERESSAKYANLESEMTARSEQELMPSSMPPSGSSTPRDTRLLPKSQQMEDHEEVDLPGSVYGAAIYALSYDITEVLTTAMHDDLPNELNLFQGCFSVLMLVTNYVVQGALLNYSNKFVVTPAVNVVQKLYEEYHVDVFENDGQFSADKWSTYDMDKKRTLCQLPLTHLWFTFLIIWIWAMVMTTEFRETIRIGKEIQSVKPTANLDEVIYVPPDGGSHHLRRLTPQLRFLMHVFITIPKGILNFVLLFIGWRWLLATPDFGGLILNSLALGFIIELDELLYTTFLPKKMQVSVEETKFFLPVETTEEDVHHRWKAARASAMWFAGTIAMCLVYLTYGQSVAGYGWYPVLPGYKFDLRDHCEEVLSQVMSNLCRTLDDPMNCFPYGTSQRTR